MKYNYKDVIEALRNSGIKKGDTVFFTTSLGMLGVPTADINTQEKLNKLFFDAIREVLGEKGTMLIPTYSYTFGESTVTNKTVFDPETTPSRIGPFPNFFLKQPGVIRSLEPMMSIAGFGPRAKEFLDNIPPTSYGEGSAFSRLTKSDAKCCSIGLGSNWIPFIHYADWLYQVPFRYDKFFHGLVNVGKKTKPLSWIYSVGILAKESIANAHKIGRLAEQAGIWQYASLGRGRVYTAKCREYFDFICDKLENDKWVLATGPRGDPFSLEEKRVKVGLTKVLLGKFNPTLWPELLSVLRRDTVSDSINAVFDAIAKYFPLSFSDWPSGSGVLGRITPEKWICHNAYISTLKNKVIFSYDSDQNFVRSYSKSINKEVSHQELLRHINIQPDLAPFDYRDWGFCLPKPAIKQLTQDRYKVSIKTDFYYGKMRTAELFLKGTSDKTVIIASYLDGPRKVNESLSGLVAALSLYQWLKNKDRNLNYIFLLLPGEIGFTAWLSNYYDKLFQTVSIIHLKWMGLPLKPLKQTFNIDIPQYIFSKVQSLSNSDDTKIIPQNIEESIKLLQDFINQLEEVAMGQDVNTESALAYSKKFKE